ncbi:protein MCM10 homolog [Atheta coriaria]|uniref:protein MCM10 homolog n=1 Tax=Dalotia coriaria TaxID=877792 RepID=UPI0031F33EFE
MDDDFFNNLLTAVEETTAKPKAVLKDDPNFLIPKKLDKEDESLVHTGLTDSSDDEDNRDFQLAKYNSFGKAVKYNLATAPNTSPSSTSSCSSSLSSTSFNWSQQKKHSPLDGKQLQVPQVQKPPTADGYTDPIFGIRIINPLVPIAILQDRMQGRQAINLNRMRLFVESIPANADWVVSGVIVHKTGRTSQKGNPFSIWTLSDMHGELKTFSLFLFGSAYKDLWKCSIGTVVGVLNPSVFEKKQGSKDEAVLSVDNVQKVMIIGQSKDFGTCRSTKKDGTPCTAFVNLNRCEYCVYHVKQEYQKCSKRSELQSSFSGRGLNALRNKVLGKNEVFYAGKSFSAVPATRSRKLQARDEGRMNLLSGRTQKTNTNAKVDNSAAAMNAAAKKRAAMVQHVEVSASRRQKDLELLKKLGGGGGGQKNDGVSVDVVTNKESLATSSEVTLKESKSTALSVIAKLKAKNASVPSTTSVPTQDDVVNDGNLSDIDFGLSDDEIDKDSKKVSQKTDLKSPEAVEKPIEKVSIPAKPPTTQKSVLPTKSKALLVSNLGTSAQVPVLSGIGNKLIDLSSPITKKNINRANLNALKWVQRNGPIQKENPNQTASKSGRKRVMEVLEKQDPKRRKIQESDHFSQRFKQMMAATSKHTDLLEQHDNDEAEKYFNKLEMKEKMEEKMIGTYKVECKAVRCLQCKYTSFSAADRCKEERHPLKVFDAVKRFFKCGECGNRTVSLNVIPTQSCKKCGSGKWERTGMMKEKIVVPKSELSIRGGEQEHINSNITNANINLLVPEN